MEQSTQLFYQLEEQVRKNSLKQNLYIQNTPNNFLIMITDERGNIKVLQEHTKENFITDWTFLNLRFKSTTLVTFSNSFVLLPKELASLNFEGGFSPFMVTDQP